MIRMQTYGKIGFFKNLFQTRKGWIKVYLPFRNLDLHEEEQ